MYKKQKNAVQRFAQLNTPNVMCMSSELVIYLKGALKKSRTFRIQYFSAENQLVAIALDITLLEYHQPTFALPSPVGLVYRHGHLVLCCHSGIVIF